MRLALILCVSGIFFAATSHAQTSTQSTTDTTTTDATQTTIQTTTTQTCNTPCTPQALPRTSGGNSGTSAELYVNAGGMWPMRMDEFDHNKLKAQDIYGLKGGLIFGGGAELEASVGYLNHFEMRNGPNLFNINTDGTVGAAPSIFAFTYDVNGAWNMGGRRVFGAKLDPYVVAGVGGLTAEVRHGSSAFLQGGGLALDANGNTIPNPGPTKIIHDGDTFFTFNYGGGIKAMNLWGPIGLRADIRGRTVPNFYHSTVTWPEVTGGLLVSWGEK